MTFEEEPFHCMPCANLITMQPNCSAPARGYLLPLLTQCHWPMAPLPLGDRLSCAFCDYR